MTPGTMADKTHIEGAIALSRESGSTVETFSLDARVKIFGAGPIVERFIEHQARDMQEKAVAVHARRARGLIRPGTPPRARLHSG